MEELFSQEIKDHVKAIGKWFAEDIDHRVACVVLGTFTKDGIECCNSLLGRADKISRALYGYHKGDENFKKVFDLVVQMTENPIIAALIEAGLDNDVKPETENSGSDSLKKALANLLDKFAASLGKKK